MDRQQLWNRCKSRVASVRQVLTRDFDYSHSDFFFGLDVMMAVGGVRWNTKKSNAKRCWNVYHWMICVPQALILWNAHRNVQDWASLEIILSSLQGALAMLVTVLRMRILLWFYEPLMEVKRYVNRRKFGRDLAQSVGIRSEAFYNVRKIVMYGFGSMFIFGFSIPALNFSNNHIFKLPFDISRDFPNGQYFCEKAVNIWIVGTAFLAALDFLIIYMVLAGLTAEGKVIALSFSEIFGNTDRRVQQKLESAPGNSRQQAKWERFYFWKYLQEEFNSCIELHIEFLAIKNKIKPTLNGSFLITYYSTVVTLACGCIYLSQMQSVTLFSLLTLFYCSWVVIECALLTRLVNLATEANASIGWQVYDLEWPAKLQHEERFREVYRSVQKAVMTVLAVSRQPLRFNCFGFFEFTQDQFWILLNMTYNLYTFFRNFV
ncbi:uncharacterized protein LOC119770096 [Culex quinquefasciatus]|uniref:uncharacterized protein LOC119770096 n=1 Tax=Culex quinquefasciatus TaxID=7176 RepID=UPI0018E31500|nr:uncharacterized protein LOC119770096 [Culex quinquefasciatus]